MRQKIMTHVTVLVVLTVLLTYLAASLVMYHKYRGDMEADVIKEAEYIRYALENRRAPHAGPPAPQEKGAWHRCRKRQDLPPGRAPSWRQGRLSSC